MDYQAAFDQHVRTRLESSFGKAVAMMILASASNACNASLSSIDADTYARLCESIAIDQRVIDMWGAAGAEQTLKQWKQMAAA